MAKRTDDLAARMAASRPAEGPAFRKPPRPFPVRLTLDLTEEQHRALQLAAIEAGRGVTMASLLRDLIDKHVARR